MLPQYLQECQAGCQAIAKDLFVGVAQMFAQSVPLFNNFKMQDYVEIMTDFTTLFAILYLGAKSNPGLLQEVINTIMQVSAQTPRGLPDEVLQVLV